MGPATIVGVFDNTGVACGLRVFNCDPEVPQSLGGYDGCLHYVFDSFVLRFFQASSARTKAITACLASVRFTATVLGKCMTERGRQRQFEASPPADWLDRPCIDPQLTVGSIRFRGTQEYEANACTYLWLPRNGSF
jgi:hypothetical protein